MNASDVAAVLDNAVLGEFGAWQATCPICSDRKATQVYELDGLMVVDRACKCPLKAVRARVLARYAEHYGKELPELLTPSEAKAKTAKAAKTANGPHGSGSAPNGAADPDQPQITATPYRWRAAKLIPPREWLYDRHYIRTFLSCSVSASGVGKSSVSILEAIGMAVGRNLLTGDEFPPLRTWYWNGEDPHEELERRVQAVCLHYGITENDLGGRFFLDSGRNQRIKIVQQHAQGVRINRPVVAATIETLVANQIDAVTFDPFISTHSVPENDNTAIDQVAAEMAGIADAAKCAVEAVHHVRKTNGAEITVEDARGGSALVAKGRSIRVFNTMTVDEASKAGINVNERRLYFRSENGKGNMARPASVADWRRLTSVLLGNETTARPSDEVGVVVAWKWPDAFVGLTADDLKAVQNKVGGGEWRADPRADAWVGHAVAKVLGLDAGDAADGSRIKELLKGWLKSGALKNSDRTDPDTRKKRMFVEVGTWV